MREVTKMSPPTLAGNTDVSMAFQVGRVLIVDIEGNLADSAMIWFAAVGMWVQSSVFSTLKCTRGLLVTTSCLVGRQTAQKTMFTSSPELKPHSHFSQSAIGLSLYSGGTNPIQACPVSSLPIRAIA